MDFVNYSDPKGIGDFLCSTVKLIQLLVIFLGLQYNTH